MKKRYSHGGAMSAHSAVQRAVRKGVLPSVAGLTCADCGAAATAYDHRNYNKPLDVEPVCNTCNIERGPAIPRGPQTTTYAHGYSWGLVVDPAMVRAASFEFVDFGQYESA